MPIKTRQRLLASAHARMGQDSEQECLSSLRQTMLHLQALAQRIPGSCATTLCWSHAHHGNLPEVARALQLTPRQLKLRLMRTLLGLRLLEQTGSPPSRQQVQAAYCLLYSRLYPQRTAQLQHWLSCSVRHGEFLHFERLWQQLLDPQSLPALLQAASTLSLAQRLWLQVQRWLSPYYLAHLLHSRAAH